MRSVVRPDLQQAAALRIPALQRLVNMPPQRQPVSHCLPPASSPSGPIGSFGQTIPAKFSKRNDILDRTPITGWPLPLSDQQRMQIFDAVMAESSQPVTGADALKPASELSSDQALNGMRPLPESVRSIDGVERLYYLKAKSKILLVEPATRTVVGEIEP